MSKTLRNKIIKWHQQGYSTEEIAALVKKPAAEIEMIIKNIRSSRAWTQV